MRNVRTSGFIAGARLKPEDFDLFLATSSGTNVACYFITGQMEENKRVWTEELMKPAVFSWWNPIVRGRWPADIDYIVDEACRSFDRQAFFKARKTVYVTVVNKRSGRAEYLPLLSSNFDKVSKATMGIPFFSKAREVYGEKYFDGALYDPLPAEKAYLLGFKRILALCNHPLSQPIEEIDWFKRMISLPLSPNCRRSVRMRSEYYRETCDFIRCPPHGVDVFAVSPDELMECDRFERDPDIIKRYYDEGYAHGQRLAAELSDWISGRQSFQEAS